MKDINIGGTRYAIKAPWHPIRHRLHAAMQSGQDGQDVFAALCACLGASIPMIDGRPEDRQRAAIRANVVDYGEHVMNLLMDRGVEVQEISEKATEVAKHVFGLAPSDEEVEEAANFSEARAAKSTDIIAESA
tara:strand:+ start:120 stop:518 length:399 start_codon:yes stop_codon:yes gene_type:complete